jgi:disulfide bond formation protein DsbB
MKRYAAIPWPVAGLLLTGGLLVEEALLTWFGGTKSLAETAFRIAVMALGATCLALITLPPRRIAYLLGALVCAALMGWALWLQYGLGLEPCPLCSLQRLAVVAIGIVFLLAAIHGPGRVGAAVYAGLTVVVGGFGIVVAARHVWLQSLPKDAVPSCGMGLNYMLETLPLSEVIGKVFAGSGECAEAGWYFMQLAIPAWTLVFFVAMIAAALALVRED